MSEWEDKFNKETLDKGMEFYLNKKVVDLKETQTGYSAAVLARVRHEVSVKMLASGVQSMSCKCPVARSGRNCEHMAALMYAIDAKKEWLSAAIEDGIDIPCPEPADHYSGQFKLRLPKSLHKQLAEDAKRDGISMNQYCVYLLAQNNALHSHDN